MRGPDIYSSTEESESESESESAQHRETDSYEEAFACEGELLMIRRTLNNQSCPQPESQRENIFHARCKGLEKPCSLIIDSWSCCNCCITRLVEKLN